MRATRPWTILLGAVILSFSVVALAQPAPQGSATAPAGSAAPSATPSTSSSGATPPPNSDAATAEARKEDAFNHFQLGISHFENSEWEAALAEFLLSRQIFPSRGNTKDAAICLRKVNRFDEALDMFETLLRDFKSDLSPADAQLAQTEIASLRASVGSIQIRGAVDGATVVIDGKERGTTPLAGPLRTSAGSRHLRVSKAGYLPFNADVNVVGLQTTAVDATLDVLTQAGRLHVTEKSGKVVDVVLDNAVVGKTPWEGAVAPGDHSVLLRGEGHLGTQPTRAVAIVNVVTPIDLAAEDLAASARVEPAPGAAVVWIDGVSVGPGVWDGRLRVGAHHVEAKADGFLPFVRDVTLADGDRQVIAARLQIDPSLGIVVAEPPAISLEIDLGPALGLLFDGDVQSQCTSPCVEKLPFGFHGVFHGTYQFGSGFGLGLDAGYLLVSQSLTSRAMTLRPKGLPEADGTGDDSMRLSGLTIGASAQYHKADDWPFTLRLGAGVFVASMRDQRSGTVTGTYNGTVSDTVNFSTTQTPSALYLYVAPEARIGRRFGKHFELNIGLEMMLMKALKQPTWPDPLLPSSGVNLDQHLGIGSFNSDTLASSLLIVVVPGVGARYEF